jgi:PAS domain S-box-containing protein
MSENCIYGIGGDRHFVDAKNIECADDQEATNWPSERFVDLLTLSYEPMLAWRLDGVIEFWNAGAQRLYGFAPDEAVGRSSHALLQTKFPTEFAELRAQLRNERRWSGELRHTCKDGREVIVDSRMQLFGGETVLEVNRDVTTAAIFRAVFEQSGIFAGITDLRGYLREANNLSLESCGYTREQVLDRPFWDTPGGAAQKR